MAFSYTPGGTGDINAVRLRLGDTNPSDIQFQDEEITLLVTLEGSADAAALAAAQALAFRYAKEVDKWVGDLKILASQKAKRYQELYESLSASGAASLLSAVPTAGGVYQLEKDSYEENEALAKPFIKRGMHDNNCS